MVAVKKRKTHGGAPKRSQRSRLQGRGYSQLRIGGLGIFNELQAKSHVEHIHKKGCLAQALHMHDNQGNNWWIVMYRRKK